MITQERREFLIQRVLQNPEARELLNDELEILTNRTPKSEFEATYLYGQMTYLRRIMNMSIDKLEKA